MPRPRHWSLGHHPPEVIQQLPEFPHRATAIADFQEPSHGTPKLRHRSEPPYYRMLRDLERGPLAKELKW